MITLEFRIILEKEKIHKIPLKTILDFDISVLPTSKPGRGTSVASVNSVQFVKSYRIIMPGNHKTSCGINASRASPISWRTTKGTVPQTIWRPNSTSGGATPLM